MSKNFQKRKLYLEDINVEIPARTQRFWKKNRSDAEGMQSKRKNDDFHFFKFTDTSHDPCTSSFARNESTTTLVELSDQLLDQSDAHSAKVNAEHFSKEDNEKQTKHANADTLQVSVA